MSGLLNTGAMRSDQPMSVPILQQALDTLQRGIAPDVRPSYDKVVVAGMAAGLSRGPKGVLASLLRSRDPVADAARGAIALVLVLRRDARGIMPVKALIPAAMALMLHALDWLNRTRRVAVGVPELDRATHIYADAMFAAFHINQRMLNEMSQRVHGIIQDPQKMQMVNIKAGIIRHPGAAGLLPPRGAAPPAAPPPGAPPPTQAGGT